MVHWLKLLRTTVKIASVIISIAFLVNSVNGIVSTVELADGEAIEQQDVEAGDFEINFENKTINVGIDFNNTLYYDLEDILISMTAVVVINETQATEQNFTIMDVYSNGLENSNNKDDIMGQTIKSGEVGTIGINVQGDDFIQTDDMVDFLGLDPFNWNLADLISNPGLLGLLGTDFKVYLTLDFGVGYAFGQFRIEVSINMAPETFELGLGL